MGDLNDIKIISMSIGTPFSSGTLKDGVTYAYNKGKLIFAAAGTSFSWTSWWGVIYPAALSQCQAVTGVKESGSTCSDCHDGSQVDFTIPMQRNASSNRTSLSLPELPVWFGQLNPRSHVLKLLLQCNKLHSIIQVQIPVGVMEISMQVLQSRWHQHIKEAIFHHSKRGVANGDSSFCFTMLSARMTVPRIEKHSLCQYKTCSTQLLSDCIVGGKWSASQRGIFLPKSIKLPQKSMHDSSHSSLKINQVN